MKPMEALPKRIPIAAPCSPASAERVELTRRVAVGMAEWAAADTSRRRDEVGLGAGTHQRNQGARDGTH